MILLYAPTANDVYGALKQRLNGNGPDGLLESYTRLDDLLYRLHQPRMNLQVGVFAITDLADLDRLIAVRDLLTDLKLVLTVADDDPQTLSKAHTLAPRFISFLDNGNEPLLSVVERMVACRRHPHFPISASRKAHHI
jgi:hypothetical protein